MVNVLSHTSLPFTPFRGRERELAEALEAARAALRDGHASVLQITGARGRGKSRLVDELLIEVADLGIAPPVVLRASAAEQGSVDPIARVLRQRFGVEPGLEDELAEWLVRGDVREIFGELRVDDFSSVLVRLMGMHVGLPLLDAVDDPSSRWALDRNVLAAFLARDGQIRPIIVVLEDLHAWPEGADLLKALARDLRGRVLLVLTSQAATTGIAPSNAEGSVKTVELGPLAASECELMIRDRLRLPAAALSPELVETCCSLSAGSPGLLGEALAALETEGALRRVDTGDGPPRFEVDLERLPDITGALGEEVARDARLATLDRPSLRVLEHAASVGSVVFSGAVAAQELALAPAHQRLPREAVQALLAELAEEGFLLAMPDASFGSEAEYVFRDPKERERLLAQLAASERSRRHLVIADWLESRAETAGNPEHLEALGEHLEAAASSERGASAYLAAAKASARSRSLRSACELYRHGLELMGNTHARLRVDALHDYGVALVGLGESQKALEAFQEMLGVAETIDHKSKMAAARSRIGRVHRERGALQAARAWLEHALELFTEAGDLRGIAAAHDDLGRLHWMSGEYARARDHVIRALELRSTNGDPTGMALSLDNLALVEMDAGRHATAMEALELAIGIRQERGDRVGVVQCLHDLGRLAQRQNEHELALETLLDAVDVSCEARGYPYMARLLADLAETQLQLDQLEDAEATARHAEQLAITAGDQFDLGDIRRIQARIHLELGQVAEARLAIDDAAAVCDELDSPVLRASILRTMGEISALDAADEDAETEAAECFVQAVDLGKQLGNQLEVAKTYRAFARCAQGFLQADHEPAVLREARRLDLMADEIFESNKINLDDERWFALRLAAVSTEPLAQAN